MTRRVDQQVSKRPARVSDTVDDKRPQTSDVGAARSAPSFRVGGATAASERSSSSTEHRTDSEAPQHGSGGLDGHLDEDGEPSAAVHDGLLAAIGGGFDLQEVLAGFDEEGVRSPADEVLGLPC